MDVRVRRSGFGIQHWLWINICPAYAYILAWLMAAGMIAYLYPLAFLAGHGAFFEHGDASQHVSGWIFFRQDSWHFPILKTAWLNYPEGTSIAFTDSIPLLALPLKLLSGILPEDFHYFGLWHAMSFLLQATGAVFLIRALGIRHLPGTILATAFALCWPALTFRFGHTALMSQGLLLFALGIYLRGCGGDRSSSRYCAQLVTLSAMALLIHPYFLAMIYPVLLVYLTRQWRAGSIDMLHVTRWVAGSISLLLAIVAAGGYFIGKGTAAGGYGVFSLNLLAPFCGGVLCAFTDATGGQLEGLNYFGAGLLFLLLVALFIEPKSLPSAIRRHRYLFLFLLLLTLFALSTHVYLGKWALVSIDLPRWLQGVFGIFRASGRFFWPVGYCVLFFVLAVLLRKRSLAVLVLLMLALTVQWLDTRGWRDGLMTQSRQPSRLDTAAWKAALNGVEYLQLYPTNGCGKANNDTYVYYQYLAARAGVRINTGYTARQVADCTKGDFASQPPHPDHVYIHLDFGVNRFDLPPLFRDALRNGGCAFAGAHLLCQYGLDIEARWHGLLAPIRTEQINFSQHWAAESLPTVIGHLENDLLVPKQPGAVGYLSYGPYLNLSAGIYTFKINYLSNDRPHSVVGEWDAIGHVSDEPKTLARGALQGSDAQMSQIQGMLALDQDIERLEIRMFSNGGDVRFSGLSLEAWHASKEVIEP